MLQQRMEMLEYKVILIASVTKRRYITEVNGV
jgi:hypothetical protein